MKISDLIRYYNQEEIIDEILRVCKHREVVARFRQGFFGTRPSVIQYRNDIINLVRQGAISFHMSEERWSNPLNLKFAEGKRELDEMRRGWDLIFDIDTKAFNFAKICAELICEALEFHGIKNYSIKFSGGSGFHIGVPYESFPKVINGKEVRMIFPEAAQIIASYISHMIEEKLSSRILSLYSLEDISKMTGKDAEEMVKDNKFNPFSVIEIDTIAISSRHLIRMPYSINEKKGRVSLPLKRKELAEFEPEMANLNDVKFNGRFLDGSKSRPNEAKELFIEAMDWFKKSEEKKNYAKHEWVSDGKKTEFNDFPPCIKNILNGMKDGRKRALFILINFLKASNYSYEEIEKIIEDWNRKNDEPLRNSYIKSQLNWSKKKKLYLPPSCSSLMYYKDIGVCRPDDICETIKNPLSYARKHSRKNYKSP